ncbi:MAG: FAD-dependent oxidoreductase, partial [Actinomycetota bacterium]|nr:FAD-dependent oxidoreductase [Actinomycetota bacterium]
PTPDELRQMLSFVAGAPVGDDYAELLATELTGATGPVWRAADLDPDRELVVGIIGAGMSGLAAAHHLLQAGVRVVILEKNADVGGTWFENRYPGCRVDVPNHLYSYSFLQRDDWPQQFSPQGVLLDYFRGCADELGVRPHIRFDTEVTAARYRDDHDDWELNLRAGPGPGPEERLRVDVLVSAVGQLNRPSLPDLPGRDSFHGPSVHSARWDPSIDLTGARVAVVGTAASGIQLIPELAQVAAEVHVFQRTPNWFTPVADYRREAPAGMQWLLRNVPHYREWYRLSLFWRLSEGALPAARVDPAWARGGRSVSELNDLLRQWLTGYLEAELADRADLLAAAVPSYPPLAKRMLLDDGTWPATLKRESVRLVTAPIERVTPTGIETRDGHHEVDAIVYATGFRASEFLMPMRVTGPGGIDLHERWAGDPRAYLGLAVPGFPNLFCLYGPNTNLVANGSIIFFSECGARYVAGAVRLLLERRARSMEVRREVHDAFNAAVDAANAEMVWGVANVNSWYRAPNGRVTQNWPFTLLDYWQRTCRPDPEEFLLR